MIKAIFFDAMGTLFYLTQTVGDHYAVVGKQVGLDLDPQKLDRAFYAAWKKMPARPAMNGPRPDDDKDWWRDLVNIVLADAAPGLNELDRDNFFEIVYEHFAQAGVWELYPEVVSVLEKLHPRFQLAIVSNFDARLRGILAGHEVLARCPHVFISTELGHSKPSPAFYRKIEQRLGARPEEILIVGDDLENDVYAPRRAGWQAVALSRRGEHRDQERDAIAGLKELLFRLQ